MVAAAVQKRASSNELRQSNSAEQEKLRERKRDEFSQYVKDSMNNSSVSRKYPDARSGYLENSASFTDQTTSGKALRNNASQLTYFDNGTVGQGSKLPLKQLFSNLNSKMQKKSSVQQRNNQVVMHRTEDLRQSSDAMAFTDAHDPDSLQLLLNKQKEINFDPVTGGMPKSNLIQY